MDVLDTPPGGGWSSTPGSRPKTTEAVSYRLVVFTDKYAGNFEREMTAAATGVIGECDVGESELEAFFEAAAAMGYDVDPDDFDAASPFEDLMEQRSDDNGCYRPCAIARDLNNEYNAVAMFMYRQPTAKDMAFIAQRARAYAAENNIQVLNIQFIKTTTKTTDKVVEEL